MHKTWTIFIDTEQLFSYNKHMNKDTITDLLIQQFSPSFIEVLDESHLHTHHKGTPHTSNTHFNITIVSEQFMNKSLIERHRSINTTLKDAFLKQLHALKITAKTPDEWH